MRPRAKRPLVWLAIAGACFAVAACGGGDDSAPAERPRERADKLPKLAEGWKPYVDRRVGLAIGRPPGWLARTRGRSVLLRSPDRLVAISLSADRTVEAVEFPLSDFVVDAAEALPGYRRLKVGRARPFAAKYPARSVRATGIEDGVRQRMLFVALRRKDVVTYPVLVARNDERSSGYYYDEGLRIVRTLRGRPPTAKPSG
jgi:hypothetical protein